MRKYSNMLLPLLSQTMQGLLGAVTLYPQREWYLSELAAFLEVRPSTLQRSLGKLTRSGILISQKSGNRVYYHANSQCPILPELAGIMAKTVGIVDVLHKALVPFQDGISVAFVYGSIAQGRDVSGSDVDLLVIGRASPSHAAAAIRQAGKSLAREVNVTVYTGQEFAKKLSLGHHFVTAVMNKQKIFLVGDEHDLARVGAAAPRGAGARQQAGD
jgi:predicted nucleotidyltransferase